MADLDKLYKDYGFPSADRFYTMLRKHRVIVTKAQVNKFVADKEVNQLMKRQKRLKEYSTIVSNDVMDNFQMDIMVYDRFEYKGYKYILNLIDVHTRFAFSYALKSREMKNIIDLLSKLFKEIGYPKNINCDNEFNTKDFNDFCSKHKIKLWFSYPNEINKNAIVERYNGTLARLLQRHRIGSGDYNWPSYLNDVVLNYNNAKHRSIKAAPVDVWNGDSDNKQTIVRLKNKLSVGDSVRIFLNKGAFDKGDKVMVSEKIHTIVGVKGNRYELNDTDRLYREYELSKVIPIEKKEVTINKQAEEHKEVVAKKKIKRKIKKEGIEPVPERTNKRDRKQVDRGFFVSL